MTDDLDAVVRILADLPKRDLVCFARMLDSFVHSEQERAADRAWKLEFCDRGAALASVGDHTLAFFPAYTNHPRTSSAEYGLYEVGPRQQMSTIFSPRALPTRHFVAVKAGCNIEYVNRLHGSGLAEVHDQLDAVHGRGNYHATRAPVAMGIVGWDTVVTTVRIIGLGDDETPEYILLMMPYETLESMAWPDT